MQSTLALAALAATTVTTTFAIELALEAQAEDAGLVEAPTHLDDLLREWGYTRTYDDLSHEDKGRMDFWLSNCIAKDVDLDGFLNEESYISIRMAEGLSKDDATNEFNAVRGADGRLAVNEPGQISYREMLIDQGLADVWLAYRLPLMARQNPELVPVEYWGFERPGEVNYTDGLFKSRRPELTEMYQRNIGDLDEESIGDLNDTMAKLEAMDHDKDGFIDELAFKGWLLHRYEGEPPLEKIQEAWQIAMDRLDGSNGHPKDGRIDYSEALFDCGFNDVFLGDMLPFPARSNRLLVPEKWFNFDDYVLH